ncbi:hypothetical protein BASA83_002867 [Batrachochytrium salamandrivorans]|nr:hypothetical protein BASA83_002867 [Batrachochytrium salamandrivorans]
MGDGDGIKTSKGDDGAHDMMVRFEKVVLAPRGETGSITQMPPTTPLHPHSSAISTLSNVLNPNHLQPFDPYLSISSLSSLNKLLLPGTLRIGPSTFVNTFFVDCGADDLFMDSKLASDLHIPLLKLSTPIKLRLADGDSSSLLTHRTAPLQLHIGKHVETTSFYVTNLCHGIILGYSWLERHNPSNQLGLTYVDTSSSYLSLKVPEFPQPIGLILPSTNPGTSVVDTTVTIDAMEADVYPFVETLTLSDHPVPPEILADFATVFSQSEADILPEHREFDCSIDLKPGVEPSHGKIYQLTREEDTVLQEWISDNLRKGAIRSSSSPHGAPCFFVKQKDKLRLCMDYRGLNQNTVKDRNPIPLISEMLRTLSTGKVFTTLDLRGAYNLLRIRKGDEPKTSFITKYGQVRIPRYAVWTSQCTSTVPADDEFPIPRDEWQCHFYQTEIKYLGYIISSSGVSMDPSKIKAVQEWPAPRKVRDLQVFLGFTNFYRALVHDYSNMTCHMTKLFKKDTLFIWGPEQQTSFENLKTAFANSTLLLHPDDSRPFILETDASDYAISGILSQYDENEVLRPIAFYARQMNSAERNYEIYDKELLAVVESFKHWRHFLQGGLHAVTVLCDHKNLEYFMSTKKLTRRQARWSLDLSEYDFTITHRSGKLNGRADPLSRRHDYKGEDDTSNFQRILDPTKVIDLQSLIADMDLHVLAHSEVLNTVFVEEDDWPLELPHFRFRDDTFVRILPDGKSTATYVRFSQRTEVMRHYHESLAHLKFGSIIDLVSRRFWWPKMKADLRNYISRCPQCQLDQSASRIHAPLPIRPVPPVALPFERWGIDFYGPMVETKSGNKYLITCIDYATRWVLAKPVKDMTESAVAAFLYELMMTYGAPFEIISDRGKSFLAEGIDLFERENKIRHFATTPYHPQTNGMVKRMHAMLGHGLTTLGNGKRDRWDEYLPQVLLALRTRTHASHWVLSVLSLVWN